MKSDLLISAQELAGLMADDGVLVFDCRFDLMHPGRGHNSWLAAHIPGAVYAHLDDNLAGRVNSHSGRHPLPATRSFAAFLARSGWTPDKRVVAYDANGGAFATRLWWLMKYFGLGNTSVLNGGIGAWMASTYPMESGKVQTRRKPSPELTPARHMVLNTLQVMTGLEQSGIQLLDARAPARFEGTSEPIDSVAGHIPGAQNHPMDRNFADDGNFRSEAELRSMFRSVVAKRETSGIVHMCGSGVTACQNQFAMELAGIEGTRVYIGSWSEWIRDPTRPIMLGAVADAR